MPSVRKEKDLAWESHPFLPIQIKPLLSRKGDRADVTCFLVKIPVGQDIPEHIHESQEDILFLLSGKGRMWIDGLGDFPIEAGTFIRVPRNTRHRIYDVTEEILNYDVFVPPLF